MIAEDRVRRLNERPVGRRGGVIYWMQQAQRAEANPALAYAVAHANEAGVGVRVVFGLDPAYPEATHRAYAFMVAGLRETAAALERRGIGFTAALGSPPDVALGAARGARLLVCDRGYLAHQRAWRARVAREAECAVVEVEGEAVVPLETASGKAEYAARTLRPKILRRLESSLAPVPKTRPVRPPPPRPKGLAPVDLAQFPAGLKLDGSAAPVDDRFPGGPSAARRRFDRFLAEDLPRYAAAHNRPDTPAVSHLAMALHFGHLSPVEVAAQVLREAPDDANRAAFLEQLCVRRELANNFTAYTPGYDRYETAVPDWARKTLAAHAGDPRPHRYDAAALEEGRTHDPYWNAMMRAMRETGYLHNHLRMYWGKKVLEWMADPGAAFETLLRLNNRYFLDGRDPSSYAGVGWIFGLHDRPWGERPVYGTVRCMTAAGLERKCDIRAWVAAQSSAG